MPTLLSSVTCHVSFGDSQREVVVPPNCQCFPSLFVLVLVLVLDRFTRTRPQSVDRRPRSRVARATQSQMRYCTTAKRWLRRLVSTTWQRWLRVRTAPSVELRSASDAAAERLGGRCPVENFREVQPRSARGSLRQTTSAESQTSRWLDPV